MKAISIRQPWAWAILHAGKRVENRTHNFAGKYRGPVLLHASAGTGTRDDFDSAADAVCSAARIAAPEGFAAVHRRSGEDCGGIWVPAPELPRGAIVGRARLVEVVFTVFKKHRLTPGTRGPCILCGDSPVACAGSFVWRFDCEKADPWAAREHFGLVLADVEAFAEPIPYKGQLGLFNVADEVVALLPPAKPPTFDVREGASIGGIAVPAGNLTAKEIADAVNAQGAPFTLTPAPDGASLMQVPRDVGAVQITFTGGEPPR